MGYDPIEVNQAASQALRAIKKSGGGLPIYVDLDKYGIGPAILGLFAQGGGSTTVENVPGFWGALKFDPENYQDVHLVMIYDAFILHIPNPVRLYVRSNNECGNVAWNITLSDEHGNIYTISTSIARLDTNAIIFVKVV